jgi:hypothetical protein
VAITLLAGCASTRPEDLRAVATAGGAMTGTATTSSTPGRQRGGPTEGVGSIGEPTAGPAMSSGSPGSTIASPASRRGSDLDAHPGYQDPAAPQRVNPWGEGNARSFLVPAVDIIGFEFLLNQFDRHTSSDPAYDTDLDSIKHNLHTAWVLDDDPFAVNQFMHPYQGSIYHGFARSAGLTYWESLLYDAAASYFWEIAGETVPPSINDQINTTFAGSFLGESLFRMASYTLEEGGESPSTSRSVVAALVSPATGINRLAYGDRFDGVFPSHGPPIYARLGIGVRQNKQMSDVGVFNSVQDDELVVDFVMDYGLPGKDAYEYKRPFDYFKFEAALVSSSNALPEDVMVRGLLFGAKYDAGADYQGVWGLYGGYDYICPEVFSISSTSVSLGTTAQWKAADGLTLQGTALGGVGWTAAGTIADAQTDRNYAYGVSPQALGALRILFGDLAVLDVTGRAYYLGVIKSNGNEDSETILRGKAAFTVRVAGRHAVGVQYVASTRDVSFADPTQDTFQAIAAVSIFYTLISDTRFGAVDRQ